MIQANELRINCVVKIMGEIITLDEDRLEVLFASRNYEDVEGIELTPEILEACGFIVHKNGLYVNNDVWLEAKPYFKGISPVYSDGTSFARYMAKTIYYLHQLQNLFFALTGQELYINTGKVKV